MSQAPYTGPPQSSGGGSVLVVVLIVLGVVGLLCVGVCGLAVFGLGWGAQRAAESMDSVMEEGFLQIQSQVLVANNEAVKETLGEPLEFGTVSAEGVSDIRREIDFEVSGSKDKANVHAEAHRSGNQWKIIMLQVRLADGSTIDLSTDGAAAPELTPEATDPPTLQSDPIESSP